MDAHKDPDPKEIGPDPQHWNSPLRWPSLEPPPPQTASGFNKRIGQSGRRNPQA